MGERIILEHVKKSSMSKGLHAGRAFKEVAMKTLHKTVRGSRRAQGGGSGLPAACQQAEG